VIQQNERNIGDQRGIEFEIFKQSKIPVIRKTHTQIFENGKLDEDGQLIM
jgi:hypothetical protein